jgi:hypothetical protein
MRDEAKSKRKRRTGNRSDKKAYSAPEVISEEIFCLAGVPTASNPSCSS